MIHQSTSFSRIFGPTQLALMDFALMRRMKRRPDKARLFFRFGSTNRDFERYYVPTGAPMPSILTTETATVSTEQVLQGPYTDLTPVDYGVSVSFTHVFRREDKRGLLRDILNDVADAVSYHRRLIPAEILNQAFTGTTYRDGVTLCSTAHPLYGGKILGAATRSNKLSASTVTQSAIELMITSGLGVTNEMGYLRSVDYRNLVFDRWNWAKAMEILKSPDRSDTASRAVNVLRYAEGGLPNPVMYDMLDQNIGFFLTTDAEDSKALILNREGPYRDSWTTKADRAQYYAMFYARTIGVPDWRWIQGTPFA